MKLWFARILVVVFVVVIVVTAFYWDEVNDFFASLRPDDSGAEVTDDGVFTDSELNYGVRLGSGWQVYERLYREENAGLSADTIKERLATCGASCAALGIVKIGDFPGADCETSDCANLQGTTQSGASLTVYVFANPAGLLLDEFLATALGLSVWADHFSDFTFPDGRTAKREVVVRADGTQLSNVYTADGNLVYWLDQDIISDDPSAYGAIERTLIEAVDSFEIQ